MRLILRVLGLVLLLAAFVVPARAAEFRTSQDTISISTKDKTKNLYVSGKSVTIEPKVLGDLIATGGSILVNGEIEQSLFVAGGTVTVRSQVNQNARIAGGTVTISGTVNEDLFVAGGTVNVSDTAVIHGDVFASGGTVTIDGRVEGNTVVSGGTVTLNGSFKKVTAMTGTTEVGDKAKIDGDFTYTSANNATVASGAVITGKTNHILKTETRLVALAKFLTVAYILRLLGTLLVGWLLVTFWNKTTTKIIAGALKEPLKTIGAGALVIFIVPILLVVLLTTLIGIPLAALAGFVWLHVLLLGSVVGKITFGAWVYKLTSKAEPKADLPVMFVGILLMSVISFIPVIGWLAAFIFFLLGVGASASLIARLKDNVLEKA